jgi:hypothetical protein
MSSLFLKPKDQPGEDRSQVDKFLASQGVASGRLIFALDATASRGPTWELACGLTGGMIREAASPQASARLEMQLVYFRGGIDAPAECSASQWTSDASELTRLMSRVGCRAGYTQIAKVLAHAERETLKAKVSALVLIGDKCEPQGGDDLDRLASLAIALGRLRTPVFAFQEGDDQEAEKAFRRLAVWSGGAYGRFNAGSARELGELLRAAAAFAVGGIAALEGRADEASRLLIGQMRR